MAIGNWELAIGDDNGGWKTLCAKAFCRGFAPLPLPVTSSQLPMATPLILTGRVLSATLSNLSYGKPMTFKNNRSINKPIKAFVALVLAWIVPGAGQAFVGRPLRGIIIFLVIGATFWGGIAMGGVMTVDHEGQKWWFAAEMLTGVHGLVGWQNESKQLEKLEPKIQADMAESGIYLNNNIKDNRRELSDCIRQITQLEQSIRTAATGQERETLQGDLNSRKEAKSKIERQIIVSHRQLQSLRGAHIVKVLAKEKLALVAPMATLARAYAGVAGLLNLMCIFDAVMLALIGTVATPQPNREDDQQ
jgi:TM2 domain-containing membrane protein YozV